MQAELSTANIDLSASCSFSARGDPLSDPWRLTRPSELRAPKWTSAPSLNEDGGGDYEDLFEQHISTREWSSCSSNRFSSDCSLPESLFLCSHSRRRRRVQRVLGAKLCPGNSPTPAKLLLRPGRVAHLESSGCEPHLRLLLWGLSVTAQRAQSRQDLREESASFGHRACGRGLPGWQGSARQCTEGPLSACASAVASGQGEEEETGLTWIERQRLHRWGDPQHLGLRRTSHLLHNAPSESCWGLVEGKEYGFEVWRHKFESRPIQNWNG